MSIKGFLTEHVAPVLMSNTVAGTSYAATGSTVVDLQTQRCDSCLIVAVTNATTLTGFTMTAQASNSTSTGFGGLCTAAGSTASLMTVSSTDVGKILLLDVKNAPNRYLRVSHTGLAATNVTILGFPYNSKVIPCTTGDATSVVRVINPTTA